jgi:protein-disulfide isomerase-like protein with CxxC motif
MSAELFFLYDSHCPWSYASTKLVNEISENFPEITLNLWHCARFEGDETVNQKTLDAVKNESEINFGEKYIATLRQEKDSTIAANIMAWVSNKIPNLALTLLNAIQAQHFSQGNQLTHESDFNDIIAEFKMSPPQKVFNKNKLSKDAEATLHDIFAMQELIGTNAIPALLLAVGDNLILLNHHLYLNDATTIVEAIKLELNK